MLHWFKRSYNSIFSIVQFKTVQFKHFIYTVEHASCQLRLSWNKWWQCSLQIERPMLAQRSSVCLYHQLSLVAGQNTSPRYAARDRLIESRCGGSIIDQSIDVQNGSWRASPLFGRKVSSCHQRRSCNQQYHFLLKTHLSVHLFSFQVTHLIFCSVPVHMKAIVLVLNQL